MLLAIENLHVSYGRIQAVKDLSFHVNHGEIVTLIGANGAGKSSTLMAIAGLIRSQSGAIRLKHHNIANQPMHRIARLGINLVPEGRRIFSDFTVKENLQMGAYRLQNPHQIQALQESVYDLFPRLQERERQIAGTLSGGEQQMLAIARGLMADPQLLLLDEPSLGLAPLLLDAIFEHILQINRRGITILLVEQNARLALQIAHRGYVLETGRLVFEGSAHVLQNNPEVRRAYLGISG